MNSMKKIAITCLVAVFGLTACMKDEYGNQRPMTDSEKGALIGAGIGALIGLTQKNKRTKKVLIGAVGGGLAGYAVGSYMDSQKKDLNKVLAGEIQSGVIELKSLPDHHILVTMTSASAFDVDSSSIKPSFYSTMDKISNVVNRYGKTHLTIVGHTDSTGTNAYNQALSERRANAVLGYFSNKGVIPQRLKAIGKGETMPRADNQTAYGRSLNRRVDIIIEPVVAN